MLILLTQAWPWIVLGTLLIVWSLTIFRLSPIEWAEFIISLFWMPFTDDTAREKEQLSQPVEEVVDSSPGCFIFMVGIVMTVVGLMKLLA